MTHYNDLYHLATDEERAKGLTWYQEAHAFTQGLADKYNLPIERVAGIIAALSPNCPWNLNCKQAKEFIRTKGRTTVTTYYSNKEKAKAILKGAKPEDILKGAKVKAFYSCLLDPNCNDEFVVDTMMIRAYFNNPKHDEHQTFGRPKELKQIKQAGIDLALRYDLRPSQFQAIVWTVWKRITDTKPFTNEVNYEKILSA